MTRARRYDYELLKREYIYDAGSPPCSYTDLAEKHGMPRSLLTDRGARENWTEQREEFRKALGVKTTEAMTDEIIKFQIATRERMMSVGLEYLDQFAKALTAGEIKVTTRDALGVMAMMRTLIGDQIDNQPNEEGLIDSTAIDLHPDEIRRNLKLLEAADRRDDERDEGDAPAEPPPTARQN